MFSVRGMRVLSLLIGKTVSTASGTAASESNLPCCSRLCAHWHSVSVRKTVAESVNANHKFFFASAEVLHVQTMPTANYFCGRNNSL